MSAGDWEPMWIGPPAWRLYAALHSADDAMPQRNSSDGVPSAGVVLVPPLLHELPRSRRFLTEVAGELAGLGLPCLRFDFHGTGDSHGRGDGFDFATMHYDLDLAVAALRETSGVAKTVVLAWRASALALQGWLERGGGADLVVLWEPVVDGAAWLQALVAADAAERALRPPPRPGVCRLTDPGDGQLMGFPASERLRGNLARTHLDRLQDSRRAPVWLIAREGASGLLIGAGRVLSLPANAPSFDGGAAMDATFFLSPQVREVVAGLGQAVRQEAWA